VVEGWDTWERQTASGAVESEQSVTLRAPVVEFSDVGAQHLGQAYWREVEQATRRVVRAGVRNGSVELRILGKGPALLSFGAPQIQVTDELASCSYPIRGGLLARRSTGEIIFAQVDGSPPVLRSTIRGFFPRFAARQGEPDWTGALYNKLQSRVHVAVSRRYFARLIAEGQA
jgi:hypothetical protein